MYNIIHLSDAAHDLLFRKTMCPYIYVCLSCRPNLSSIFLMMIEFRHDQVWISPSLTIVLWAKNQKV